MEDTGGIMETAKRNIEFNLNKEKKSRIKEETETVDSVMEYFISESAVNVIEKYEKEGVLSNQILSNQILF